MPPPEPSPVLPSGLTSEPSPVLPSGLTSGVQTALDRALLAFGDRWSLQIVNALFGGPRRYNELFNEVTGIAPNVLAARLKHLEQARLVESRPYQERPRRLEYSLTTDGRSLSGVLGVLESWAALADGGGASGVPSARTFHDVCGSAIEWRPWCPTCEVSPSSEDEPVWI